MPGIIGTALLVLAVMTAGTRVTGEAGMSHVIDTMPAGYHLLSCDDCGVPNRQPHVLMDDCYLFTFSTSDTDADLKSRSAVFSYKQLSIIYTDLDPKRSYVVAMTYATDQVFKRVQSLWAEDVELHGPLALPKGKAKRVLVRIPESVTQDGKMKLEVKIHGEVNATVSFIELWATGEPTNRLRFSSVVATPEGLAGRLVNLDWDGVGGLTSLLRNTSDGKTLATAITQPDGSFRYAKSNYQNLTPGGDLQIVVNDNGQEACITIPQADQQFKPTGYRPMPVMVMGLKNSVASLDGDWHIDPGPDQAAKEKPLDAANWRTFEVPGQWAEQGFDIPQDKPAAVAKEFMIPKEWAGYRIFLRFDAIHAGTHYWLNGRPLGYSENLFTPVEWEITDTVNVGQINRLDLQMTVSTASERLSMSSSYAGHSLGGIDRAVRIYALPKLQISSLRLDASLDANYQNGELAVDLGVDNPDSVPRMGVEAAIRLYDAKGKEVTHSTSRVAVSQLRRGSNTVSIKSTVTNPLKWNAEQPNLYKLVIELLEDGKILEQIERNIGFRKIEIKDRQLYVNGVKVKLAGVCRHEIDPLTGRANTMRHAEDDVKLFKSANLNFVRTSHYPCTQEFLDAADRYGLYVESEAPLCGVAPAADLADLHAILTPTSAMIDYNHSHPSVIIWSLANESHWSENFDYSNKLCKQLDPTRPTTLEFPMSGENDENCDIVNRHYQPMPFDDVAKDDPRPFLHGECFYLNYHERTDVAINPGLRELWGHGSADPASNWGKECIVDHNRGWHGGIYPGAWSHIYHSKRLIGSEIWSGIDDISYLPDGKIVSCENGNAYWGLIDGWRRPKPELFLSKMIFSPVWFPERKVEYKRGQASITIPVENRYSFLNLDRLSFLWQLDGAEGRCRVSVPPAGKGWIHISIPMGTPEGSALLIKVVDGENEVVRASILLGDRKPMALPRAQAGAPKWKDDGASITVEGKGFGFTLNRKTGNFDATSVAHKVSIANFPVLHVTRHDFGDLNPKALPYAEFPDAKTRVIDNVMVAECDGGLEITIKDHYDHFTGSVTWLIDKEGTGKFSYNYTYTGDELHSREVGLVVLLLPECNEIKWQRWSEWGDVFPEDSICRSQGSAKALRDKKWSDTPVNSKPSWPWKLDQSELGTNDFRSIKFNIYEASLAAPGGSGIRVSANANAHIRACLAEGGTKMHLLSQCPSGPAPLRNNERVCGEFAVEILR